MWSPALRNGASVPAVAAMPDEKSTANEAPSSAAIRCSAAMTVGLRIRE